MNSFKERMIANYERGYCSYSGAYSYTRDQMLDAADMARTRAKEAAAEGAPVSPAQPSQSEASRTAEREAK